MITTLPFINGAKFLELLVEIYPNQPTAFFVKQTYANELNLFLDFTGLVVKMNTFIIK